MAELSESLAQRHADLRDAAQSRREMEAAHQQAITAAEQIISEQRAQLQSQLAARTAECEPLREAPARQAAQGQSTQEWLDPEAGAAGVLQQARSSPQKRKAEDDQRSQSATAARHRTRS